MRTYTYHRGSSYGWIEVPIKDIQEMDIEDSISGFSYRKGNLVYLEEDCDAHLFFNKLRSMGIKFHLQESHTNNEFFIQNLKSFYI